MEAAKNAGLGGLHLFDTSLYQPKGPVRYGTDEWHEHVQYAIRTAAELGLELGTMNCPGWSMSGGPWITPEMSMKMIVWTETPIAGGKPFAGELKQPETNREFYRDVVVVAVPAQTHRLWLAMRVQRSTSNNPSPVLRDAPSTLS